MLVAPPAQRKREVEDKKGKARSVLGERNRAKTKGARGNEGPNNETKPARDGCSGLRDVCAPWSEACKEIKSDCTPSRSASTLQTTVKRQLFSFAFFNRDGCANDERIEKMF